jgi:hypothetical protein
VRVSSESFCVSRLAADVCLRSDICGQLPEALAKALEPLLTTLAITATVGTPPSHAAAPVPVQLLLAPSSTQPQQLPLAELALQQRRLAAVVSAAQASAETISEGTGQGLRRHYDRMLAAVLETDGHLLDDADRGVVHACAIVSADVLGLLLRLRLRKRKWLRVTTLGYADVEDCDAATVQLEAVGLLVALRPGGVPYPSSEQKRFLTIMLMLYTMVLPLTSAAGACSMRTPSGRCVGGCRWCDASGGALGSAEALQHVHHHWHPRSAWPSVQCSAWPPQSCFHGVPRRPPRVCHGSSSTELQPHVVHTQAPSASIHGAALHPPRSALLTTPCCHGVRTTDRRLIPFFGCGTRKPVLRMKQHAPAS